MQMKKFRKDMKNLKFSLSIPLLMSCFGLKAQTYNVAYNTINFGGSGVTITNKVGTGTALNNIVLYQNVITIGGQQIDAIVRTQELSNATISTYDYALTSSSASNNLPSFFSPQFSFGTGGGYAVFKIQFILGGSYNNSTNTGTLITLQNVLLNTYDLDGNNNAGTNQYAEFGGFTMSELASPTNLTTTYNSTLGLTKFRTTISTNTTDVTDVRNRARVTYNYISEFTTKVGAEGSGAAYYFLDFSAGSTFTSAISYTAPILDLNTTTSGVDNVTNMTAPDVKNFTLGLSNIAYSGPTLDNLKLNFLSSQILDGANEKLLISGATSGGSVSLNFTNGQAIPNVVFGGVTYAVTASISSGRSFLLFTKSGGGTLTLAQIESLLDALQYQNAATNATKAWRYFNVTTLAGSFETPVAQFQLNIDNVLPVELTSFSVNCDQDYSIISWQTASEHNSASFILERSADGTEWYEITEMDAAGNSNFKIDYQYEDLESYRFVGYYRLTQIDTDGKQKVYNPIYTNCTTSENEVEIYPNPVQGDFVISISSQSSETVTINFVNTNGMIVLTKTVAAKNGFNQYNFNTQELLSGMYYVSVQINDTHTIKKLIVQ
jgi:hypothetical protein